MNLRGLVIAALGTLCLGAGTVFGKDPFSGTIPGGDIWKRHPAQDSWSKWSDEPSGWQHQSALGISISGGNSLLEQYNIEETTKYRFENNLFIQSAHYVFGSAEKIPRANNWHIDGRYEKYASSQLAGFVGSRWEGDTFAGIRYRANVDIGMKWIFLKALDADEEKRLTANMEIGYRYAFEERVPGTTPISLESHFLRLLIAGKYLLRKDYRLTGWIEFLPDLTNLKNLLINFGPTLSIQLTQMFALEISLRGRFDGEPATPTSKNFDFLYLTSISLRL